MLLPQDQKRAEKPKLARPRISTRFRRVRLGIGLLLVVLLGATYFIKQRIAALSPLPEEPSTPLLWKPVQMPLPPSILVFADAPDTPASPRAWYVDINYKDHNLRAEPWLSDSESGRETASVMAQRLGALVAINGGYFDMDAQPARTFSLVLRDGKLLVPNIPVVTRSLPPRAYPVTRSAFGIRSNRTFDVAWITSQGDALWAYPEPVPHTETSVAPAPTREWPTGGHVWDVVDAIGAGPTLLSDGIVQDTYENEVFFESGFPNDTPYSRASIGYTKDKHLILFTTDKRQPGYGLTLLQLAQEMQRLGCVEAMNLDGGGSETLVVNGQPLNQEVGQQRPVTSILAITSDAPTTRKTNEAVN